MEVMYENLINTILKYNPTCDTALIKSAYDLAVKSHAGQVRKSGEAYVTHPIQVAQILAEMEMDEVSIAAALLHDTIEDTNVTHEQIQEMFGNDIVELVEGVTKLGRIPYSTREEQQVENLRKMFLAMAKDIRVILIKLADRLHNIRTLQSLSDEKRRRKAWETLEVYAPLAHRLGIFRIKTELEDLSLKYLDPVGYVEIVEHIRNINEKKKEYLQAITKTIEERLESMNIEFKITSRTKNVYSTYKKMYSQNKSIEEIYDLFAVRVIVDTVADCYAVLGMVHELYKPIPGRFKDYIAMPKPNMYQSLHSTLIGTKGTPFEIQIRTWEMHQTAEYGIAAHWKYKEGKSGITDLDDKLAWLRQLLEIQMETTDANEFLKTIKIDLFDDEVFVFTPKGDVINLPAGANAIDFAFTIHSAVGNKMVGAKVNGKIAPIDYALKNGDIIEIITSASSTGPSYNWIKMVKTAQARNKINQWFKKENREENIQKGKDLIDKELKKLNSSYNQIFTKELCDALLKKFSINNMDDLFATIGYGGIPISRIIPRMKEEHQKQMESFQEKSSESFIGEQKTKSYSENGVIVEGIDNCLVRFSRCCNPVPGDKIVGYVTRGRGVSIHRADCSNIVAIKEAEEERFRLIKAKWTKEDSASYVSDVYVDAIDRRSLISDVMGVIYENKAHLGALNAKTNKDSTASLHLSIEVTGTVQLETILKKVRQLNGVLDVTRQQR